MIRFRRGSANSRLLAGPGSGASAPARAIAKPLIHRYNPRHLKHIGMRRRPAPLEAASINGPQGPDLFGDTSMAQHSTELKATARPRAGKGAARQARREGKVPG
ncbi:MAG: hypothetical protein WC684_07580, partial [Hyphomicrobium sp.]